MNTSEKPTWPYIDLMRKFSQAQQDECKAISYDTQKELRPSKQFPTGSKYEGYWDSFGMNGNGRYVFTNGVIYEGEFEDGLFHGIGELQYPHGETIVGTFRRGRIVERSLIFSDGLYYNDIDWMYCKMPDRRFTVEYEKGVQPGGESYKTAEQPTRKIPEGCYDTGDGFYDPKTKTVYENEDFRTMKRSLSVAEQNWVVRNCRTDHVERGPWEEFYEEWLEPEVEAVSVPPPAAVSKATAMFDTKSLCTVDDFSDMEWSMWSWVCEPQFSSQLIL